MRAVPTFVSITIPSSQPTGHNGVAVSVDIQVTRDSVTRAADRSGSIPDTDSEYEPVIPNCDYKSFQASLSQLPPFGTSQ
jgi:hypothetical protein